MFTSLFCTNPADSLGTNPALRPRRIAELREGRRTECVAQLAMDQRLRFTQNVGI